MENGSQGTKIQLAREFVGANGEMHRLPLKYESEGIKKITSILHLLIAAYNNPSITLAIDELDSGIYEYLLGELLRIIQNSGKGQLIFTSHNLYPLETLESDSIVFTTTKSNDRYTRIRSVRASYFVGKYSGDGLTALSIIFPIQLLITALATGTGAGINILISRMDGTGRLETQADVVKSGMALGIFNYLVFACIGLLSIRGYYVLSSNNEAVVLQNSLRIAGAYNTAGP